MKAASDKKDKRTSVTMTQSDFEVIEQKAKERRMMISPFLVDCAVHSEDTVTPEKKAKIQNIINAACMIVEEVAPERVAEIRKEGEDLWQL